MADRCLSFAGTAPGRFLIRRLGLPPPAPPHRWSAGRPTPDGSLPQLTAGKSRLDGLGDVLARRRLLARAAADAPAAAVLDATGVTDVDMLAAVHAAPHPVVRSAAAGGGVVVLGALFTPLSAWTASSSNAGRAELPTSGGPLRTYILAALLSPFKRPRQDAEFPRTRLVLPGVRVDLGRLAAYERVCGFGTGADALPVTYPHVLGFPLAMRIMASRAFPLPLLGLVHTSIEITQRRELAATGEYEVGVHVEGLVAHRRGTEAVVVTDVRVGDKLVWESRSTYLARHRTTSTPAPRSPGAKPLPVLAEWRLGEDVGRRYAAASGDRNPIHLYPLTARLFGFPRAIAHGMWTVARCLAEQGPQGAVHVRAGFRAPVLLPGTVTYAADGPAFELRGGDRLHLSGECRALPESGA